jgi:hypothetical protein
VRTAVHGGAVDVGVVVLDRILLTPIIAELGYTLRFVVCTHAIAVEPFLYIGLIAVVRRILIVTAQLERGPAPGARPPTSCSSSGARAARPALAVAVQLVRRSATPEPSPLELPAAA